MRKIIEKMDLLNYKYIFLAIMLAIPAEICFSCFKGIGSFTYTLAHILTIFYYSYLFKGIFVSAVRYPYIKLQEANNLLKSSKEDLWEILDGLPLGLLAYDNNLKVSYANTKLCSLLECTAGDIVGLSRSEFLNSFIIEHTEAGERPADGRSGITPYKSRLKTCRTHSGGLIKLNSELFMYKNGIMSSFTDARKEQELQDLKIQTKTILESVNSLMAVLDRNGRIIICNKPMLEFIEVGIEEVAGKEIHEFLKGLKLDIGSVMNHAMSKIHSDSGEATITTQRGVQKSILFNTSAILNVDSETIGYVCMFTDITKMKKEQLRIQQQEKLALIGQMGSGIVHETKNLLASVKGYCQLIKLKIADEHLSYYVNRIENVSDDLNKVIAGFLSLAKPAETEMDVISLNELIEDMSYMLESPSFVKGVSVSITLCDNDADVLADASQIKQVILNIAKNAIEAMSDTEKPAMGIATRLSSNGREMQIIVSDNGTGIPDENKEKLGTPFFTTKEYGTGLGLNVSYRIITEHGGRINVSSMLNKGTTFIISIPCLEISPEEQG